MMTILFCFFIKYLRNVLDISYLRCVVSSSGYAKTGITECFIAGSEIGEIATLLSNI